MFEDDPATSDYDPGPIVHSTSGVVAGGYLREWSQAPDGSWWGQLMYGTSYEGPDGQAVPVRVYVSVPGDRLTPVHDQDYSKVPRRPWSDAVS